MMNIPNPIHSPWMAEGVRSRLRPIQGVVLVELLLLGLAGLGGLALLLQQKPLPSQEDVLNALKVLDKSPDDPDANTIAGKWKAFVMGDYDEGMNFLKKSKDSTLKSLADHEKDFAFTALPEGEVKMGDEWVAAAKKFPALWRIFYDRAIQWYKQAWTRLDAAGKAKLRAQGLRIAAARPPGIPRKGLPTGWASDQGLAGKPSNLDPSIARTGSYSVKLAPADEKVQNSVSAITSDLTPVEGKTFEYSAYLLSDGTENAADKIVLRFFDGGGNMIGNGVSAFYQNDIPFWNRVSIKGNIPENAARAQALITLYSKKGNVWVDDVSLKLDNAREVLKNGSFEEK